MQAGSNPPDWEALAQYVAGESPPEVTERIDRWLAAHPEDAQMLSALARTTEPRVHSTTADIDVEAALRRVTERRIHDDAAAPVIRLDRFRSKRFIRSWPLSAAAIVATIAVISVLRRETPDENIAIAPARTVATGIGQVDSLVLADGTRILVAPGSEVVLASAYGASARDVRLRGEAFFEVTHDDARPFTVTTADAVIRDIGTAFDVRTDAGDAVVVTVTTGAVNLRALNVPGDSGVLLQQGDRGVVRRGARATVQPAGADPDAVAWMRGRLVFRNASLAEVQPALRRWYGMHVKVDSALAGRHVTAAFERESPDQVLEVIALALGAVIERRGDTAFVRVQPAGTPRR